MREGRTGDGAMNTRGIAIATSVAGLVALATTIAFQLLPAVTEAGKCMTPAFVVQFEFAGVPDDLTRLFGNTLDACRASRIAAVDQVNTLDVWVYIPSYTAFAVLAALFLGRGRFTPAALLAMAAGMGALAADYVETLNLLAYTPDLSASRDQLAISSAAAWTKFWLLALNSLALAWLALSDKRRILAGLLCVPIIGVAAAFFLPNLLIALTVAFTASWVPLLVMALREGLMKPSALTT